MNIRKGRKSILKHILESIEFDCHSTTGNNLWQIMLLVGKIDIHNLHPSDSMSIQYHPIREEDAWKVSFIQELVDAENQQLEIMGMENTELREILDFLCVS